MYIRRHIGGLLGAAALCASLPAKRGWGADLLPTTFGGVRMGVCLYDFRDLPRLPDQDAYIDSFIACCRQVGVGLVEINASYLEPPTRLPFAGIPRLWDAPLTGGQKTAFEKLTPAEVAEERERLRAWRLETPLTYFTGVAAKFRHAGIEPFSYVMTFTPDMTEAEIDAIFRHTRALGVNVISTNQTRIEMAPRLAPFADRYAIDLGFHNHTGVDNPNEVASRESLERLFTVSPRTKVNLDVGHFVAADQDTMALVRERFDRITHFHMKDRRRHLGPNVPWGEGDAPLKEVVQYIRDRRASTPAFVEYEYPGTGSSVAETARCLEYLKSLLA